MLGLIHVLCLFKGALKLSLVVLASKLCWRVPKLRQMAALAINKIYFLLSSNRNVSLTLEQSWLCGVVVQLSELFGEIYKSTEALDAKSR